MTNRIHFPLSILFALLFASLISTGMVVARILYSGQLRFVFLVWNLFLAWLPLLFALAASGLYGKRWRFRLLSFLWLLFLPNAPYIVTDLLHLRQSSGVPLWYDMFLLFSFALTGLLLGFVSLYVMQMVVSRHSGNLMGWMFVLAMLGLSSFGVYIGRFLRWNSWDLFFDPMSLLADILNNLLTPHLTVKTALISALLCAIFIFTYVVLFSLPRLRFEPGPAIQREAG